MPSGTTTSKSVKEFLERVMKSNHIGKAFVLPNSSSPSEDPSSLPTQADATMFEA